MKVTLLLGTGKMRDGRVPRFSVDIVNVDIYNVIMFR